jgi:dihydrofolate synthase/folylpolyglutamate synthase
MPVFLFVVKIGIFVLKSKQPSPMVFSESAYGLLLEEIFQRFPSVQKTDFATAYKPGLEGMTAFCEALGHPERTYRSIHIAGTNGKGSVASLLTAVLASCGLRTGLYTSPHLVDFRERARIVSGRDAFNLIPKEYVFDFLTEWKPYFVEHGLSFFEITTGLAFKWFADEGVDAAVIETGLGGRLDSTNVTVPEMCIVTTIGLDHCALLGDTRPKIAAEKAGIFKAGVPALVASRDAETEPVFRAAAAAVRAPLHFADVEAAADEALTERLDLRGPCQGENLRTVLCALHLLGEPVSADALAATAARTGFHARWEHLLEQPEVIADIGHNPPALKENFARLSASGRPLFLVFGIMADKDLDAVAPYMPASASWYLAAPKGERALRAPLLLERLRALHPDFAMEAYGSVAEALSAALRDAAAVSAALVYIGGSTFTVAEALEALNLEK